MDIKKTSSAAVAQPKAAITGTTGTTSKGKNESLKNLASSVKTATASGDTIINQFKDKIPEEQLNMIKLQQSLEQRSQIVNMVTNLLRTIHEMAMSVVRNFRVAG